MLQLRDSDVEPESEEEIYLFDHSSETEVPADQREKNELNEVIQIRENQKPDTSKYES